MTDKSNYSWQTDQFNTESEPDFINSGCFIWVFNWHEIPHLGISVDGKYFSLTIHGIQRFEEISKIWRMAEIKEIPLFLIKIRDAQLNIDELDELFAQYLLDDETCLQPLKALFGSEQTQINTLIDLIHSLNAQEQIEGFYANSCMNSGRLSLIHYSKSDVLELINKKSLVYETRK